MKPEEDRARDRSDRQFTKSEAKWLAAGILAILFAVFVAQNSGQVRVDFVFFSANIRLIWVFLGCGVIGAIIDRLLQRRGIL